VIRLESISFNHDSSSATHDALNLRRNATTPLTVPEWRRGACFNPEDSPAAYARASVHGHAIRIKTVFSSDDPAIRSVQVRALDNALGGSSRHGCLGALIDLVLALLRLLFGNVLGVVKPTRVHFVAGTTGPVALTLVGARVGDVPVGVHTTEWRWQYRTGRGPWTDLAVTRHRIYVLVDVPTAPWQQAPSSPSNTQLPWTEVLDVACRWGALATTADQAAAKVTAAVYALGPGTVEYDCPGGGSSHYSFGGFACTAFLDRLHGGLGNGRYVNCSDCGTIVSTFTNALGGDLWSSRMGYGFGLNELLAIGSSTWQTACGWGGFNYHEVAWSGGCTAADEVWDACLRVDGDADPVHAPHVALLPVDMRFGAPGDGNYRDRLATPATRTSCAPDPATRQRRAVS
jgi:hypothetical protein